MGNPLSRVALVDTRDRHYGVNTAIDALNINPSERGGVVPWTTLLHPEGRRKNYDLAKAGR